MELSIIYARSEDRCIGNQGRVPWDLPDELASFHQITHQQTVIMGRRTYEDHLSALPDRRNIVISHQQDYPVVPGITLASSLPQALDIAAQHANSCFIIGGVALIMACLPSATNVYETLVHTQIEGDTYLPDIDFSDFSTRLLLKHPADTSHAHAFEIRLHQRRSSPVTPPYP